MTKIRVGLDVMALNSGHKTRGIGFYTKNLLAELKMRPEIEVVELRSGSENVDLVHYPYFDLFFRTLPLAKPKPVVVTVHDVTPLVFPKAYPPGLKGKFKFHLQKQSLQGVKAIITDSEASKKDIVKFLSYPANRIKPIYLAAGDNFKAIKDKARLEKTRQKYNLPNVFALYTGNVNFNKNLTRMARACQLVGIELVLVGSGFNDDRPSSHRELVSYREFLEQFGDDQSIRRLGFVNDEELVDLVNLATLSLYPTLYEGFGMPILEAQQCGTPVITSNVSSMPEVAGDGAILVNPEDIEEIAQAIKKVIEDRKFCQKLVEKGYENAQRFSWAKTVDQTIEVYQRALK